MNWDAAHLLGDLEAQEATMSGDLVERLRWAADNSDGCGQWNCDPSDLDEAADRIEELEAALAKAVEALEPFSEMAGEMFARNWNDDGVAISLVTKQGAMRLTFKEFRRTRATLAELTGAST